MTEQTSRLRVEIDSRGNRARVRGLRNELNQLSSSSERTTAQMSILSRSLGIATGALAAASAGFGVQQIVRDLASLENINSRIGELTGDLAGQQIFLKDTAAELSAEYRTLAGGFSRLLPLYKAGILSLQQAQDITKGLANVQAATGASSADLGRSIFGLAQGLSAGTLRAEELNQVTEALPGLLQELDRAAGLAGGGFRRLVVEGKVTSDFFRTTLQDALLAYDGVAASLSENITQSFNRTRNAYLESVEAFATPIAFAATGTANELTELLESVAENADRVGVAFQVVGGIIAANIGGAALSAVGRYATGVSFATQQTTFFINAERTAAAASRANTAAKLESALATEAFTKLKLREAQQQAASITGLRRLTFATTELAAAERAAALATANRVTAAGAATAATTRLDAANRSATISARALAVAQRAGSGALALVGGPAGAAVLAAGGLAFLALRQTEAEKTAEALEVAMNGLSSAYGTNAEAAARATQETINSQRANLVALETRYREAIALDEQLRSGGGVSARDLPAQTGEIEKLGEALDQARKNLEEFEQSASRSNAAAAFSNEFDQIQERLGRVVETTDTASDSIRASLEKLFPNDAKIAELEELRSSLGSIRDTISETEFNRAAQAIDDQIATLRGFETAAQRATAESQELAEALDAALPERARYEEFAEQYAVLERASQSGRAEAGLYLQAMAELQRQFDDESENITAEKVRDLNEALADRTATPFAQYADEIELLNRAIAELPDEAGNLAGNLQRAFANLDFEIQADLTTVSGDGLDGLARDYTARRDALELFIEERGRTEEQAEIDRVALAQSYGDQVIAVNEDIQRRLIELSGGNIAASFDLDVQSDTTELENLFRDRQITQAEYEATREAQAITHQEQLNEIVRSGEGTRAQIEAAGFQARFAGILERYSAEIGLAQEAATTLFDIRLGRETRQADAARVDADTAQAIYEDALSNFQRNGSEENRIALETAQQRRDIAQSEARKQFEDQKDAAVASARLAGGVAFLNALATPPWYVGVGLAAVALATTREKVAEIKSTQFGSGTGSSAGVVGGGSVGSGGSTSVAGPAVNTTPQVQDRTILIVAGNFRSDQEAMEEVARAERDARTQGLIFNNSDGTPNFQNVPERVVRLT